MEYIYQEAIDRWEQKCSFNVGQLWISVLAWDRGGRFLPNDMSLNIRNPRGDMSDFWDIFDAIKKEEGWTYD